MQTAICLIQRKQKHVSKQHKETVNSMQTVFPDRNFNDGC